MKIKLKNLKRIIENFLKEADELKQASKEEIDQDIRDIKSDIISDKGISFLKTHGKKIPENVIQALGSMARPLVLKLNKSDLKDDSVLLSRVFSFLRKGENQTAIDILKSDKEVPVTADEKTKKIIKRKLSDEGLNAINGTEDYLQIIEVIEKYIEAGKKEVKDDYDFLSGNNEEPETSEETPDASPVVTQPEDDGWNKESIYKIDNIYTELDKNYHLRKNEKITLDKISLGAFNKLSTNSSLSNLFFFDPPFYKTPEDAMSGLEWIRGIYQWKDNKHSRDDINVYFEETGWVNNIVFEDGYSDRYSQTNGKHTSLKKYTIALNGFGNQNAMIGGYIAVKDPKDSKIYLMSIKRAKKEGFVKDI